MFLFSFFQLIDILQNMLIIISGFYRDIFLVFFVCLCLMGNQNSSVKLDVWEADEREGTHPQWKWDDGL